MNLVYSAINTFYTILFVCSSMYSVSLISSIKKKFLSPSFNLISTYFYNHFHFLHDSALFLNHLPITLPKTRHWQNPRESSITESTKPRYKDQTIQYRNHNYLQTNQNEQNPKKIQHNQIKTTQNKRIQQREKEINSLQRVLVTWQLLGRRFGRMLQILDGGHLKNEAIVSADGEVLPPSPRREFLLRALDFAIFHGIFLRSKRRKWSRETFPKIWKSERDRVPD